MITKPNIIVILADNLGWGELGCYGGGSLRGAPTPRIDHFAIEGLLLQNFNVESDCVPTRSAFMTGRHPIRTGALQSPTPGAPQGISPWEVTLAQLLKEQGYATGMFGKWHLGDKQGRYPNDRGFDEWYGIPRTTDEVMYESGLRYDRNVVDQAQIMEGVAGKSAREVALYDLEARRMIDAELVRRGNQFLDRHAATDAPFFLFLPIVNLHYPTLPHPDFEGVSGYGGNADCMMEMDYRVGQVLDHVDTLGLRENTLVIFCSDNGPEFRNPYRGTAGPWRGTYHTAMEGSLRVPCIMRWPGKIAPGKSSNEIIHVTDLYTTLAVLGGASVPVDRPVDGIDQSAFLFGNAETSQREGFPFYIKEDLRAVKWRDWKMHYYWEPEVNESKGKLESPYIFNLTIDPKEEHDIHVANSWAWVAMSRLVDKFKASMIDHPNTKPGAEGPEGLV